MIRYVIDSLPIAAHHSIHVQQVSMGTLKNFWLSVLNPYRLTTMGYNNPDAVPKKII